MKSPLAEALRDRLIAAILPDVAFDGWSRAALRRAAERTGIASEEAFALFPRGAASLVAEFSRWDDRRMLDRLETLPLEELGTAQRIARAIEIRLEIVAPWREAVRRAMSTLAMPQHAPLAAQLLYETVDGIWYWAGDKATDFSFYTKRASLAAVHAATVLYWLDDRSPDFAETRGFLARRLGDVARLGRAKERLASAADRLPNPLRLARPYR